MKVGSSRRRPKFYRSWSPADSTAVEGDGSGLEQGTAALLRWISDVTVKRRQVRRASHCSNLLAEAILSSALRRAKRDLALKQQDKRNRLRLFCLNNSSNKRCCNNQIEPSRTASSDGCADGGGGVDYSCQVTIQSFDYNNKPNVAQLVDCSDDQVKACLSSLDSFFQELKSL